MDTRPLAALEDLDGYRRLFTDVALWAPYVQQVCREHSLGSCTTVRVGVPGTCPVFIAAERYVVKFFGRLFDGAAAYAVEREAARLVSRDSLIRTARVMALGELGGGGWPWPYLVFDLIPGVSIGEVLERVSFAEQLNAARELAEPVRRLHALPLEGSPVFPATIDPYLTFLQRQRACCVQNHREWGTLPPHLVEQIEDFLPPIDELVDRTRLPHLIHADLTRDHLIGELKDGHWISRALIDFGDAMTGDLLYELAALHLDLFGGDRRLLAGFLDGYGLSAQARAELPKKALATALLHQFNVFYGLDADLLRAQTLDELANKLWQIEP
jgi:hygromycin-B 7''-O-kinase